MNTYSIDCVRVSKPEENNFVYAIHGGPLGKSPNAHLFVVRRAQIEMSKRKKINKQTFIRKQKWIVRCLVHFFLLLIVVVVFLILFYYYGPLIAHCTLRECSSIYLCVCVVFVCWLCPQGIPGKVPHECRSYFQSAYRRWRCFMCGSRAFGRSLLPTRIWYRKTRWRINREPQRSIVTNK